MITFKELQEKLSDKEYKEVDALLNRDTLLRGNLIKNYTQRGKFETMKARDTFRRIKKNEDGKLRIDRGTEKKIKVNRHTVSKNFPELSKKPVEKYKKYYRLPEGVASLALNGGSKLIPALMTGIGAAGTIMQARKKGKYQRKEMKGKVGDQQKVNPKLLDVIRKKQKEINTVPSEKPNLDPKKNRITDYGEFQKTKPVDSKTRKRMNAPENQFEDAIPTNNASSGNIAGLPPDNPPVKRKKKTYAYGGRGSRKMWMT